MRKISRHILSLVFVCALMFGGLSAAATFSDYSDVSGHWAAKALEKAYDDGFLQGFEDGTLRPDAPVSKAQALTILCRSLNAQKSLGPSVLGLTGQEWYAGTAGKAAAMGLISDGSGLEQEAFPRGDAFALLTKGFQLAGAAPDLSVLAGFADGAALSGEARDAMAALVYAGYAKGYDGYLHPEYSITRAEFITLLYRIAPHRMAAAALTDPPTGGALLSGPAGLRDQTFTQPLFLDCSSDDLSLHGVTAGTVVVRSQNTGFVSISEETQIDRLILSGGDGQKASLAPGGKSAVKTLVVGDRIGELSVGGNISRLEVTGSGQYITVTADLEELVISGTGCQISVTPEVRIGSIRLTDLAQRNYVSLRQDAGTLFLDGSGNSVSTPAVVERLELRGSGNSLSGSGSVGVATIYTTRSTIGLPYTTLIDQSDPGLERAVLTLSAPQVLPLGETLTVTAAWETPDDPSICTGTWLVDGVVISEETVTVGPAAAGSTHTQGIHYSRDMPSSHEFEYRLQYSTQDGGVQMVSAKATVILDNYSAQYYAQYAPEAVLSRVKTGYAGDYSLQWAEANDYDDLTKEVWINAKGYSSSTQYLIWINTTYQRVNIFQGSQGDWSLMKSCIVGTGRQGHDTPVGVYTVGERSTSGWTTSTYHVCPVVRFVGNGYAGLAFHSRKYDNAKHSKMIDASIGFPVSLGCIRMYDEDVQWIYNNIPKGTTVVVY